MKSDNIIDGLKRRFKASTDQGLADNLQFARSTVASWRTRGHVPKRYARFIDKEAGGLFASGIGNWSSDETATAVLTLMRMHKGYLSEIEQYPDFLKRGGFIFTNFASELERAFLDIQRTASEQDLEDPWLALNLMVYEEFFGETK